MRHLLNLLPVLAVSFSLCGSAAEKPAPLPYPDGELGKMVRLGEAIFSKTDVHPLTKGLVGNTLACKSCHLTGKDGKAGTSDGFAGLRGTAAAFPAYSARDGRAITLQDRIDDCFDRSMDGTRPITDSNASLAMTAYVAWLGSGTVLQPNAEYPMSRQNSKIWKAGKSRMDPLLRKATHDDYLAGSKLYGSKCAACHQADGGGMGSTFPALWGKCADGKWLAYNAGAGMSKLDKAAVWIQSNMPLGAGGTLSDQEAVQVALYINAQSRAGYPPASDYAKGVVPETVRSNFGAFGLDVDTIRGDRVIP